ncbi:MAG: DUF6106 family protein [Lachnospiraceae bacterium]
MTANDAYTEDLVSVETNSKTIMTRVGIIAAAIILSLGIFLFIPRFLFLVVLVIVLAVFLWQYTKLEYEYNFLSPDLDVDKIINQTKRKKVFSTNFSEIELVAPYGSHRLDGYLHGKIAKTLDFSSGNKNHKRYSMIVNQDGSMIHVIIEPSEKTIQLFRLTSMQKVFLD